MEENIIMLDRSDAAFRERYTLASERIASFPDNLQTPAFRSYFTAVREFAGVCHKEWEHPRRDRETNERLYWEWKPEEYPSSWLNPAHGVSEAGEVGQLLSAWYLELQGLIPFLYESRLKDMACLLETTIQLANACEEQESLSQGALTPGSPAFAVLAQELKNLVYDYLYEDIWDFAEDKTAEECEPEASGFARKLVMESDLSDTGDHSWLYSYGEWITEEELGLARLLASLPEETVRAMAEAYVDGYIRGFAMTGKNVSIKSTVICDLPLGLERFMRAAILRFEEKGLKVILRRQPVRLLDRRLSGNVRPGFYGACNLQMLHDHREDLALFWGDKLMRQRLRAAEQAYDHHRQALALVSGRACVEIFGRDTEDPVTKAEAPAFTAHQLEVNRKYLQLAHELSSRYMPDEETSFTIIAWPTPSIANAYLQREGRAGEQDEQDRIYREIFEQIVRINTLPTDRWQELQQHLIDALDRAGEVRVTGRGGNQTDLTVRLHTLKDPAAETNFENCLADVNIPAGEVFTSPVLKGTSGLLHVGYVYIGGLLFRDLKIRFEDGRVADYSCANGETREEERKLILRQIFGNREGLPLGEFAIGTNTPAYTAARRYCMEDKMPVLIAEKTGPHFAVGDTCYSYEEDLVTCNPDGKRIVARENECSALRNTSPEQAYFHVHTDITIPYEELGSITALGRDYQADLIRDGRFVLPGTEALNEALDL